MNFSFPTRGFVLAFLCATAIGACSDDDPPAAPKCGNGKVDAGEDCDKTAFPSGMNTCSAVAMKPTGSLRCTASCKFDTTGCTGGGGTGGSSGSGGAGTGGLPGAGAGGAGSGGREAGSETSTDTGTTDTGTPDTSTTSDAADTGTSS